jgi:hypothetical protein
VARDGQKQIGLFLKVEFLEEIDGALPRLGYTDRSAFIRDAVYRELKRAGIVIAPVLKEAPSRVGKGGRPAKCSPTHKKNQGGQSAPYHLPKPSASRAAEASGPSLREEKLSKKEKDGRKKA